MVSNPKLLAQGNLQEALITPIPSGDFFQTRQILRIQLLKKPIANKTLVIS
jgi:hypothetical protein